MVVAESERIVFQNSLPQKSPPRTEVRPPGGLSTTLGRGRGGPTAWCGCCCRHSRAYRPRQTFGAITSSESSKKSEQFRWVRVNCARGCQPLSRRALIALGKTTTYDKWHVIFSQKRFAVVSAHCPCCTAIERRTGVISHRKTSVNIVFCAVRAVCAIGP